MVHLTYPPGLQTLLISPPVLHSLILSHVLSVLGSVCLLGLVPLKQTPSSSGLAVVLVLVVVCGFGFGFAVWFCCVVLVLVLFWLIDGRQEPRVGEGAPPRPPT